MQALFMNGNNTELQKPTISIVIPAYNEELYIGPCLEHLMKNMHHFKEVIVIDNASTDKTSQIVQEQYPQVKLVYEANKGTTWARARGLKEATGDLVAYLDADTQMPLEWVGKALNIFNKDKEIVSVSGPYRYYDGPISTRVILNAIWWMSAPITSRLVGYMVLGGNFIAKKEALDGMEEFDTSITFYGDDTDIARKLSKMGKVVFRMNFFTYSSCRRYRKLGLVRTNIIYALNYAWEVLFHHPFSKE